MLIDVLSLKAFKSNRSVLELHVTEIQNFEKS